MRGLAWDVKKERRSIQSSIVHQYKLVCGVAKGSWGEQLKEGSVGVNDLTGTPDGVLGQLFIDRNITIKHVIKITGCRIPHFIGLKCIEV